MTTNECDEWDHFWTRFNRKYDTSRPLTMIRGNLFDAPQEYALGHCVSQDLRMSKGIALEFRRRFGRVDILKAQNLKVGQTAVMTLSSGRKVFYLITKKNFFSKPSYRSIYSALIDLKQKTVAENVNRLALPKIACGLDKKNWDVVKRMIEFTFSGINIEICIFY